MEQERVIAHETAHEWWYGAVGSNPTEHAWLDEGLAEYSVMEYIEKYYGREQREKDIQNAHNTYSAFCSALKSIKGKGDLPMTQSVNKFNSLYEYVTVTYTKGMLFYQNLRSILGEKRLDNGLKRYYSYFNGKIATPSDLQESLSDSAKLDLAPVFRAWEEGKVYFGA
jgi:aminopeptidase N